MQVQRAKSPWPALVVASAAGFSVWALSPLITGVKEPWDATGVYYYAALFLAGIASSLISPKPLWAHYIGSVSGQFLYGVLFLPLGPLAAAGLLFLMLWSLLFLVGACLGSFLRYLITEKMR